jgi:hypothetical protein
MPSGETTAIIAGASAIGGGLIVAASNLAVNWLQAREARKTETRNALIAFGTVVYRIDHALRSEPKAGTTVRTVNEQMSRRFPHLDHTIGRIRRRLLEPELDDLVVEITKAMTAASLLAPLKLLPAMSALTELMSSVQNRGDDWQEEWDRARTAYFLACRELLGSGVARTGSPSIQ